MTFFDEFGVEISFETWRTTYEPYYFLGGPRLGRKINARNQSSRLVEDEVCSLLSKTSPLSPDDLAQIMAWKIGLINHSKSETSRVLVYRQGWPAKLTAKLQFRTLDFSTSIPALAAYMPTILEQLELKNPRYLLDLIPQLPGFGYVYILTPVFFGSRGKFPIYDKYAHVGATAIHEGLRPKSRVNYKVIQRWRDYENYTDLLAPIGKACLEDTGESQMLVSRREDRALWVYGHFFETQSERVC